MRETGPWAPVIWTASISAVAEGPEKREVYWIVARFICR